MTDDTQSQPLRWGILGAARIARKAFVPAIRATGGAIAAIGASSQERAAAFARDFGIPQAFAGYQPVLALPEVEAVYIPLANGLHFQWALECARAGKHCLCEKPLVLTADEAAQLHEAFEQAGCRIVEGFMWRHHPLAGWIEQLLRQDEVGELRRVHASFSFNLDRPDDYRWTDRQGGGALWDLGCYGVNAMRLFFAGEPLIVSARAKWVAPECRADRATAGWLDFGEERLGSFDCSLSTAYNQFITLVGTRGVLRVDKPFTGLAQATTVQIVSGSGTAEKTFEPDNAYEHLVEHFTRAARDPSFALHPAEDGLDQALAMEALFRSALAGGTPEIVAR